MKVSVEDVSSVKKIMHVEVPAEQVDEELERAYTELKRSATLKGFRPGKAPRSVLQRVYGKQVTADVTSKLIQASLPRAIQEQALTVLGSPQVDPTALEARQAYRYDATVEVPPAIADIPLDDLALERRVYRVGDEDVDAQLKALQKRLAHHLPIDTPRPLADGDVALIDYQGFKDGQPFDAAAKTENFTLKVGEGFITADFDEQVLGMQAGETRRFEIQFDDDHFNPKLAGQRVTFEVTLRDIRREELPPIDDAMAAQLGDYADLQELTAAVRRNLEEGYATRTRQELNEQALTALLARTAFDVPEVLIAAELESILAEAENTFRQNNTSIEELGLTRAGLSEKYRGTAEKQVRRHLVLNKLVEQLGLTIGDAELDGHFEQMAGSLNQQLEVIRRYYQEKPDQLEPLKQTLLEKKAIELIIDQSQVTDVEASSATAAADGPSEGA